MRHPVCLLALGTPSLTIACVTQTDTCQMGWNLICCLVAITSSTTVENEFTHTRAHTHTRGCSTLPIPGHKRHRWALAPISLHLVLSIYLWNCLTWVKKQEETDARLCGLGTCIKERHYVRWISWINQATGYSLSFLLTQVHAGESLRSFYRCPGAHHRLRRMDVVYSGQNGVLEVNEWANARWEFDT